MNKITFKDIMAKKNALKDRKKIKTENIYVKSLEGYLEVKSLSKEDLTDVSDKMEANAEIGTRYFIYLSISELQNRELLESFKADTGDVLVERIFTKPEILSISRLLMDLNGLSALTSADIRFANEEDLKN